MYMLLSSNKRYIYYKWLRSANLSTYFAYGHFQTLFLLITTGLYANRTCRSYYYFRACFFVPQIKSGSRYMRILCGYVGVADSFGFESAPLSTSIRRVGHKIVPPRNHPKSPFTHYTLHEWTPFPPVYKTQNTIVAWFCHRVLVISSECRSVCAQRVWTRQPWENPCDSYLFGR